MRSATDRGRVYRRCGCRDAHGHQLGTHCPALRADPSHGTWAFAVDIPNPVRRHTIRRGGYRTEQGARDALWRLLESAATGYNADPNQSLADYLTDWLAIKKLQVKPNTFIRYEGYVTHDLIPALGAIRVEQLAPHHIAGFVQAQLDAGRGRVTVHRILATLSSALGDAVREHRLAENPARPTAIPRPRATEREIWSEQDAAQFLTYCHRADPLFADLVEVLIGTGMRKGEALGLCWEDVRFHERILYVRHSLIALDNNHLVLETPKTDASRTWVALSGRVTAALRRRALERGRARGRAPTASGDGLPAADFVFTLPNGRPLHPEYVLNHFHLLCERAGVPRCGVHDLRHLAATIAISHGVPLTVVSKTLRHSTTSSTANIYTHLTAQAARGAVDTIEQALTNTQPPGTKSGS